VAAAQARARKALSTLDSTQQRMVGSVGAPRAVFNGQGWHGESFGLKRTQR